jgi:CDP-diacylglycerol--serine O-phosphatidyltransferase
MIPSLFTLGNAACGFAAIVKVGSFAMNPGNTEYLVSAAWFILLAMIFDSFDGKVARMTRAASDLGGQLDSLADAISFGIAPAVLVTIWNSKFLAQTQTETFWAKMTWFFCLAYVLAAILRLARFNVENKHDKEHHMSFVGLPTPGAAGFVASLVILQEYLISQKARSANELIAALSGSETVVQFAKQIPTLLPLVMIILAFLMVSSRVRYVHVLNRLLHGKRTFDYFTYLLFAGILLILVDKIALVGAFLVYVLSGPVSYVVVSLRTIVQERRAGSSLESRNSPYSGREVGGGKE